MKTDYVEDLISKVDGGDVKRYTKYWEGIAPKTKKDVLNRWLFAFLSIHTGWRANKDSYLALKDKTWQNKEEVERDLRANKIGLYNTRTRGIWELQGHLDKDDESMSSLFYVSEIGSKDKTYWIGSREWLIDMMFGIGRAKVSFALELIYPKTCKVVCLDTHLLQMYGNKPNQSVGKMAYFKMEQHWLKECRKYGYPSPIVRHILWDQIQRQNDTRYWSYVFEEDDGKEKEKANNI